MSKKEVLKEILSTSLYLLGVLLVTFVLVKFVVQRTEILSGSMEPGRDPESTNDPKDFYKNNNNAY